MAERMSMDTVLAEKWTKLKEVAGFESGDDLGLHLDDPDLLQKNYELVDLIWFTKNALQIASAHPGMFRNDRERARLAASIDEGRELTVQKYIAKIRDQSPILIGASRSKATLLRAVQRIPGMKNALNAHAFDPERRRINRNLVKLESVYARICDRSI
ncbi:hypothetical protein CPB85DRAFT_1259103 [Mucidula mucida]|nr:hypothetical protein CPB85DRAFT_1259103 [Mucidula mucida]